MNSFDHLPADGVRVGESPVLGLTLRRILRGHTDWIGRIAWSPDGRFLASPSNDRTLRIWDVEGEKCLASLKGQQGSVNVSWSPDGHRLALNACDATIQILNCPTLETCSVLNGHNGTVKNIAWSPDGKWLASGADDKTIRIWHTETSETLFVLTEPEDTATSIAWSPDGKWLATCYGNGIVYIWRINTRAVLLRKLECTVKKNEEIRVGERWWEKLHEFGKFGNIAVNIVTWAPNQTLLATVCADNTIRLWDVHSKVPTQTHVLEGHTQAINCLSFSADGNLLASKAGDGIRIWRSRRVSPPETEQGGPWRESGIWEMAGRLEESAANKRPPGLAFHPILPRLATLGERERVIHIWDLDLNLLVSNEIATESVLYTTARVVLVGDSGVGKTGLGWRLAHGEFKEHSSTHGQQFWVINDLCATRKDGTECEAVLWDLAGQHVYRPIHAIFLDDVDASLILFDPTNRQEPLKGAEFWVEQLAHKKKLPPSVLVGARLDRGEAVLSQEELAQFCQKHGIRGGYLGTSAKEGLGLDELLRTIKSQIPWDHMTTTVTTLTFKRVKEYVLSLKEKPDRKGVLVSPAALRRQLEATDPDWNFSDAEMMTAVGHLQTHGYVSILHSSSGQEHILLTPELLVGLASSIVLQADKHPRELGALNETELLQGLYPLAELSDLETEEQRVLLDVAVARFLDHNICFRETLGNDNLLIFPGLIKQKRPLQNNVETVDDISYIVRGRIENVYPALVVLLGFTRTFTRVNQWQRQAQYEMGEGNICGFRLIEDVEGEIELTLYYSVAMPDYGRRQFQGLFEEFLYQRDVEVTRFPPVACPEGHLQARNTVVKRLRDGKRFLFCEECGEKIDLPDIEKQPPVDTVEAGWIQREEALVRLRSAYETHLTRIKGYRRDRTAPRCYISRLPAQADWADQLTKDLRDAGIHVITNRDDLVDDDPILIADTPAYQQNFKRKIGPIAADATLIRNRLHKSKKSAIIHLVVESDQKATLHRNIAPLDFQQESYYVVNLFNLVLILYAIPFSHPAFEPLRQALYERWEKTVFAIDEKSVRDETQTQMCTPKIFISYAHKDETFKDELVVMLAGLQQRGIIDTWQDRRIEAGDEWYQDIQEAMNVCDIALLLVSKNFIASRFIRDKEVPRLLQRRKGEGMRVIPIIIRPCMWGREPILRDLQALPRDGKAVITFPEETGERDQVWTDIAEVIERQVKIQG